MSRISVSTIALVLTLLASPAAAEWKVAVVFDGDTIAMSKPDMPWVVLRLSDIDAPEKDQPYGDASREALAGILKGCDVHWTPVDGDKYGRTVAQVTACGKDVETEMVRKGAAWVYTRFNRDPALPEVETQARAAGLGLWADKDAVAPWDWRHAPEHAKH